MERKKEIRQRILKIRKGQSDRDRCLWTGQIAKNVIGHRWFLEAEDIYCYIDFRCEAGTKEIIEQAWESGRHVYIPAVRNHMMEFYQIFSFKDLEVGSYGIKEPAEQFLCRERKAKPPTPGKALMIMPGVAFDRRRNRIGYGGGYYDRYLASHPGIHTIAIAFECQMEEEIETEETDIRPELLITERRIV